jgi:Arc/MetJ-type ribon-helix-helix transcriptional regulator
MEEHYSVIEITLSEDLARFVMERVREEGYANPSEYVCALIRADLERRNGGSA